MDDKIIAYMYGDDSMFCADHVTHVLSTGPGEEFDGWAVAPGVRMSTEENLNELRAAFPGIDNGDPVQFPQPVFDTMDNLVHAIGTLCGWQCYTPDRHTIGERL